MPGPVTGDQVSAGSVVYRRQDGSTEIVLISVGTPPRWQLPKDLINPPESPEAAALREVREETGITSRLREPLEKIEYWYYGQSGGQRVRFHKVVHFFLFEFESGNTTDHDHEVTEARWVEIEQAQKLLAFKKRAKSSESGTSHSER